MIAKEELWQTVLAQTQLTISQANFATWFRDTKIVSQEKNQVVVSVPNSFAREWLENKYGKTILKILNGLDKEIKEVQYKIGKSDLKILKKSPVSFSEMGQLKFQEFKVDKNTNLNPKYTFENFIIGGFNELSHASAWAVAKNPGLVYNPLFIYGGVGLGKTHLLEAIGNEITKNFPKKKIKYIPSEKFTAEVVSAIRNHQMEELKAKYRLIDILILDDVQFLAGKEKTQEEFFHIFNHLYEKNKQIILSSDHPPKAIPTLTERLRSRFEGGMMADISSPDYETRIAILKSKSQERKVNFPDDVLEYIASNVKKNIRELEGALNCLSVYQKLHNLTIDIKIAKSLLKNLILSPMKVVTPKKIIQIVSDFYDLKEKEMLSLSRKKEIVKPRQIVMYLIREDLKYSFPFIARKLGGKDHTTAIYSYEKVLRELKTNENLTNEIDLIRQRIFSG